MPTSRFEVSVDHLEVSQCSVCSHYDGRGATCTAYPEGVPDAIRSNDLDHRDPQSGDHGIRWEPRSERARHPFA